MLALSLETPPRPTGCPFVGIARTPANFFDTVFKDPAPTQRQAIWAEAGNFRGAISGPRRKFRPSEIRSASLALTKGRAAGPDGLPADLRHLIPVRVGPACDLFNGLIRSGNYSKKI